MYLLFEKSGVGYAYRNRRLVNILTLQEPVGIFGLYDDLVDRIIVDTHSDTMLVRPRIIDTHRYTVLVSPRIICSGRSRDIGIIILVPPEDIEFLFPGKLVQQRKCRNRPLPRLPLRPAPQEYACKETPCCSWTNCSRRLSTVRP